MRTIKYFGIGSLMASFILFFAGVFVLSAFFFFEFLVLSVVYAINNRDNYKKSHSRNKRKNYRNYAATTWWYMENNSSDSDCGYYGDYSSSSDCGDCSAS